ncbi:MAG: DUF418 domain-containing protein [Winogradskyella sp.]
MQPTPTTQRFKILDVLRGFALLGVLIANMAYHSGYWFLSPEKQQNLAHYELGEGLLWLIHFVTEGKFYSIFSLLFGIGFGLQLQRAMAQNSAFTGRFSRRLLILICIGLTHAFLLYVGDILVTYAVLGFVLILFRNCNDNNLLRLVFILPLLPVLQYGISWYMAQVSDASGEVAGMDMFEQIVLTYQSGTFLEIIQTNIFGTFFGRYPDLIFTGRLFKVFAMFLLGYYIAKNRWFANLDTRKVQLKKILIWCAVIGIPCNLIMAYMMTTGAYYTMAPTGIIEPMVYAYGVPALGICYACGIALLYLKPKWQKRLNILAPFGRMALTNYLTQSLLCGIIFEGYGFGLFAQLGPIYFTLIGLGILLLQIGWSHWWLSRFQFGPAEWLWRSLTYMKIQPMKINTFPQHIVNN